MSIIEIEIPSRIQVVEVQTKGTTGATGPSGPSDHTLLTNIGVNTHAQVDSHIASTANPHGVTKAQVGLSNADNTSDANKPVSTAQGIAIAVVQSDVDAHEANTSNPHATTAAQVGADPTGTASAAVAAHVALPAAEAAAAAPVQSVNGYTGAVSLVKADLGLGNVDNTSDVNKPVSTAQQTALDLKVDENAPITGATFTKITYDAKGLVTSGTDAAIADITGLATAIAGLVPYTGATADLNLGTKYLVDNADLNSISPNDRQLWDSLGTVLLDWSTTNLVTQSILPAADLNYSLGKISNSWYDANIADLNDAAGVSALSPHARELKNSSGVTIMEWADAGNIGEITRNNLYSFNLVDATLKSSGVPMLQWAGALTAFDSVGVTSAQFTSRELYDQYLVRSMNWDTRQLYDYSGNYPSVDYGNYGLMDINVSNGLPMLGWGSNYGSSVRIFYSSAQILVADFGLGVLYSPSSTAPILDWSSYLLYDDTTSVSIDFNYKTLNTNYGQPVLNWQTYRLINPTDNFVALDWSNYTLYDAQVGEIASLDWNDRELHDSSASSIRSLNWGTRSFYNASNALVAGWNSNAFYLTGTTENSQNGAMWYDTTQKAIQTRLASIKQTLQGVIFTQTATGTIGNSTVETAITSTGVGGGLTLPTDFLLAGKSLCITARGVHSATASPNLTIKVKFGSTVILTTGAIATGNSTNEQFCIGGMITCRTTGASGTVFGQGSYQEASGTSARDYSMSNTATTTINTTVTQAITITAQWGTANAGNTISLTNLVIEVLN